MDEKKKPQNTLRDDEISSAQKVDRRGALATFGAAIAAGLAAMLPDRGERSQNNMLEGEDAPVGEGAEQQAIGQSCTDHDSGRFSDPAGNGRRCRPRYQPQPRYRRRRSCTDHDSGRFSDPAGNGRRC